jgi:hypothetical protein
MLRWFAEVPSENDGLTEATAAGVAAETDNKLKVPAFGGDLAYNGSLSGCCATSFPLDPACYDRQTCAFDAGS